MRTVAWPAGERLVCLRRVLQGSVSESEPTAAAPQATTEAAATPVNAVRARLHRLSDAIAASRSDIAIVAAITLLAAALRLWRLDTIPLGIHGNEAWTALDAQRIVREGWIGPYVISALGQPTGPLYFAALLFKFMPDTTSTARFSMALFGVATIPVAYLAFASMFNRTVAAFAALLLAVMTWHLHLSRTAFMVITWPFMEMLVLWALWAALRRRSVFLFALAGALHGLGVYSYNAYLLFVPVPFVALAWAMFYERGWRQRARFVLVDAALFTACAMATALPLINYIDTHRAEYREHERIVNLNYQPEWSDAGMLGKANLIWERAKEWEEGLVRGNRDDFGDGLATAHHPVIDPIVSLLALAGLGAAIWNWRKPQYAVVLASLVLLPWGALFTVSDGLFRRTLGLAPFVALLAAVPLAWLWERCWAVRDRVQRYVYAGSVVAVVAFVGVRATADYFGPVQDTVAMRYVYPFHSMPRHGTSTLCRRGRTSTCTATDGGTATRRGDSWRRTRRAKTARGSTGWAWATRTSRARSTSRPTEAGMWRFCSLAITSRA